MAIRKNTSTSIHKQTLFLYFFFIKSKKEEEKKKKKNKQSSILKSNKTRLTQNNKCTTEMKDKWKNHLEESFSFQTGDLEEWEVFFFFFLRPLLRWIRGMIKLIEIR